MESEGEAGASAPGDKCHDNSEVDEVASENSGLAIDNKAAGFVLTKDFDDALDILLDTGVVILCGVPGSGKTTLGHALLRRLRDEEGFVPYILPSVQEWNTYIREGQKSVVLMDDVFGRALVNKTQHDQWRQILSNVLTLTDQRHCRVIITIYPHILRKLEALEGTIISPLKDQQAVVQLLHEEADQDTKRKMLEFHLRKLNLEVKDVQDTVTKILQIDNIGPVFPWCCWYVVHNWHASTDPTDIFRMPAEAYVGLLQDMLETENGITFAAVMVLTMLEKGDFLHEPGQVQSDLRRLGFDSISDDRLAEVAAFLKGFVLAENGNKFYSRDLYEAVGLALGRSHRLPVLLKICDLRFFVQFVHTKKTATNLSVTIDPKSAHIRPMVERMYTEIVNGHLPMTCQHPSLQCIEFLAKLEEFCGRQGNHPGQQSPSLQRLVTVVDLDHKLPLLYWSVFCWRSKLTIWCLEKVKELNYLKCVPLMLLTTSLFRHWPDEAYQILARLTKGMGISREFEESFPTGTMLLPLPSSDKLATVEMKQICKAAESNLKPLCCMGNPLLRVPADVVSVSLRKNNICLRVCNQEEWYLVYRLLTNKDPDEADEDGNTLLHLAAITGNMEVAVVSAKVFGANINVKNKDNLTPLELFMRKNKTLLHKIDPRVAVQRGDMQTIVWYFLTEENPKHNKEHILFEACEQGYTHIASLLIQLGANVMTRDTQGRTLLHVACCRNHYDTVRFLFDICVNLIDATDDNGKTALWEAIENGQFDTSQFLLEHGASPGKADCVDGLTPLHVACLKQTDELVGLLLRLGASVNAVDCLNETPLHKACRSSVSSSMVSLLVDFGADINATNKFGEKPSLLKTASGLLPTVQNAAKKASDLAGGNGLIFPGDIQVAVAASLNPLCTSLLSAASNFNPCLRFTISSSATAVEIRDDRLTECEHTNTHFTSSSLACSTSPAQADECKELLGPLSSPCPSRSCQSVPITKYATTSNNTDKNLPTENVQPLSNETTSLNSVNPTVLNHFCQLNSPSPFLGVGQPKPDTCINMTPGNTSSVPSLGVCQPKPDTCIDMTPGNTSSVPSLGVCQPKPDTCIDMTPGNTSSVPSLGVCQPKPDTCIDMTPGNTSSVPSLGVCQPKPDTCIDMTPGNASSVPSLGLCQPKPDTCIDMTPGNASSVPSLGVCQPKPDTCIDMTPGNTSTSREPWSPRTDLNRRNTNSRFFFNALKYPTLGTCGYRGAYFLPFYTRSEPCEEEEIYWMYTLFIDLILILCVLWLYCRWRSQPRR